MHVLIPYASSNAPGCQQQLHTLDLPNLERLLKQFELLYVDDGEATDFSPPHERAHARALTGIDKPPRRDDGRFPWATWHMFQRIGTVNRSAAWAFITPCHWDVAADHIRMADPAQLALSTADSQTLLQAMQPYFAEDGIALTYDSSGLWLASGDVFRGLATASLDRVTGQAINPWMSTDDQARPLRRLQNEMQMLLYTHAVNEERTARGMVDVNAFWISGTGHESALIGAPLHSSADSTFDWESQTQPVAASEYFQPGPGGIASIDIPPQEPITIHIPQALRQAALREDWPAWALAWQQIDTVYGEQLLRSARKNAMPGASGPRPQLTLCGDRSAVTFQAPIQTRLSRWKRGVSSFFASKSAHSVLERL
jgi:hypothetical protein